MQLSERLAAIIKQVDIRIYEALVSSTVGTKKGDYLDLSSKEGEVSYLPANRQGDFDPYTCLSLRVSGKPVKILKQFIDAQADPWGKVEDIDTSFNNLTETHFMDEWRRKKSLKSLTDRDWEVFLYTFDSFTKTPNFKIVSGEDIRTYYHRKMYNTQVSLPELNASCMRDDNQQPFFDVYVKNPACRMLIELDDNGKLLGRALLWTTDDGETFMDRVYGNERTVKVFWLHASTQGWMHQSRNGYSYPTSVVMPDGTRQEGKRMVVSIDNHYGYYPYMDTFKYLFRKEGTFDYFLSNSDMAHGHYIKTLTSTRG